MYVDINDMVSELQCRYKDYARRKRSAFKKVVEKGNLFNVMMTIVLKYHEQIY